jgi:acylphosphatase
MRTVKITVKGRVQGVFFRAGVEKTAKSLELEGYVKNTGNGDVEIVAQGNENKIKELIDYCKKGPKWASVKEIKVEDIPKIDDFGFRIIY